MKLDFILCIKENPNYVPKGVECEANNCQKPPTRVFLCEHDELVTLCDEHDAPSICCGRAEE